MITGRINLAKLQHAITSVNGKNGKVEGIFIPIERNNLFKSDKGNVFLDIIGFETDGIKDQTHGIVQHLPKEVREKEKIENKSRPFIGSLNTQKPETTPTVSPDIENGEILDDLPW